MLDEGVGLVVVDQHAPRALALADRVLVLERGTAVISDEARKIGADRVAALALGVRR